MHSFIWLDHEAFSLNLTNKEKKENSSNFRQFLTVLTVQIFILANTASIFPAPFERFPLSVVCFVFAALRY